MWILAAMTLACLATAVPAMAEEADSTVTPAPSHSRPRAAAPT
jgi:hypothetical protein